MEKRREGRGRDRGGEGREKRTFVGEARKRGEGGGRKEEGGEKRTFG
jgi:hypothetical protein